jgi:methyl-accepting chemotaxis protein
MQDNFNIHGWHLDRAINEMNEKKLCKDCGEGYMEEGQCMECGYMEEGATFTDKHDDNPKLKGGQKDLPDELQAGILKKEGMDHENSLEDIISDMLKYMSKEEILQHFKQMLANNLNENTDHEVSMAQASLKSIISSASELMNKIGNEEINLPGWIQGHITNAENYIDQANQGYHELEPSVKDIDTMDMVTEEVSANKKTKAKNALAIHLRSAMEDGNKENIEQVKDARDRINNTKSVDELVNILGEFGYKDDEIEDILG